MTNSTSPLRGSFNPRPSLPRGDALALLDGPDHPDGVSIHAPRCREAMRGNSNRDTSPDVFQSTPLVAERRCVGPEHHPDPNLLFQSTPLVAERRCLDVAGGRRRYIRVSIHAPRCREAMRHRPGVNSLGQRFQSTPLVAERRCTVLPGTETTSRCFNPRPSLPRGDALFLRAKHHRQLVSIHAPRCREAMLTIMACESLKSTFQSTPLVAERRCGGRRCFAIPFSCFNPRPSLPRGDAFPVAGRRRNPPVSIHAPRCREAMLQIGKATASPLVFQSTPLVAERRCWGRQRPSLTNNKFQSTPLVAERRCWSAPASSLPARCFNPRPSLPRGDAHLP